MLKEKICMISLGCPKNLVDSEIMLRLLKDGQYDITTNIEKAEVIIVNTCGFIEEAKQESINAILDAAQYKAHNCKKLIVAGCLAERYKEKILSEIPEVDAVLGAGSVDEIAKVLQAGQAEKEKKVFAKALNDVSYLNNDRLLSIGGGYAYLKIAEGCDNCCTYCIIPTLRGKYRSRKLEDIENEALRLSQRGIKEIILVAQDVTRYGVDIYKEKKLVQLLRKLSKIQGIEWIRLLYCYPEEIDDGLIEEIAKNDKVLKYIDLPIQHASDKILKMMGRRGTNEDVKKLICKLREKIPEVVLRTSLIVGFPGEEQDDFQALCDFVMDIKFDRLGVFAYSREEGTKAARLKPQIRKKDKLERQKKVMELQKDISLQINRKRLNKLYKVMVDGVAEDGIFYLGRSYQESPDIDGLLYFTSQEPLKIGDIVDVEILNIEDYDLIGAVKNEFAE